MADSISVFGRSRWRSPFDTRAEDDRIVWRSGLDSTRTPELDRLAMFLHLTHTAKGIERFAHLYGLLGICEHDQPFRHGLLNGDASCSPTSDERGGYETIAGWRNVAASAQRTWRLAWDMRSAPDNDELRRRLTRLLDAWMVVAEVRPVVAGNALTVEFLGTGLLGDLAVQLLHWVASATEFDTCDNCGSVFPARRKRVAGQRSFCAMCGRPAAQRMASRDYRAANAELVRERDRDRKRRARATAIKTQ